MNKESKERISEWLRTAPLVRGTLVRGVRFRDQTFVSETDSRDFPVGALEQAWRVVDDTFQVLSANYFPPTRLSWVYERCVLQCVRRADGAILGVCLTRKHLADGAEELERLFEEFQGLSSHLVGTRTRPE